MQFLDFFGPSNPEGCQPVAGGRSSASRNDHRRAGGIAANYIAKWNGSSWSALGSGMGGQSCPYVGALAVSGTDLYAGGNFETAGGTAANSIAKWNGSSWSALGSGVDIFV